MSTPSTSINTVTTQTQSQAQIQIGRVGKDTYGASYDAHLFEQYKMYVEMTDRISSRRMLANTFFLTIHSSFAGIFAWISKDTNTLIAVKLIPLCVAVVLCGVWWFMIRSYKQLNKAKFDVIHEIEKSLPLSPYDEEYKVLKSWKGRERYFSLTKIEFWVPLVFFFLYVAFGVFQWCSYTANETIA